MDAEALQVIPRVGGGGDLQLAAIAAPCVHLAHMERAPQLAADARSQTGRRFGKADPGFKLFLLERATPRRRIEIEHTSPGELVTTVRGDLDAARDTNSLLGTLRDALPALDAGGVRQRQRF